MNVTAVIAEYNPLHNGHAIHIDTLRRETDADFIIAVMSGDYVQRGCPAVISKYERTRSALLADADLVIELPVQYSTGSLEFFAMGAVSLIRSLGIVNCISFGSECGNIELLGEAAGYLSFRSVSTSAGHNTPEDDRTGCVEGSLGEAAVEGGSSVRRSLEQGFNYSHAVNSDSSVPDHIKSTLSTPNNLLAAAYIKAARMISFDCSFHTMKRAGSGYHDASEGALSSSALRKELLDNACRDIHICGHQLCKDPADIELISGKPEYIHSRIPGKIYASLCEYLAKYPVISEDDLSLLLFYRLQEFAEDPSALTAFWDVSPSLANRIMAAYSHSSSYSGLCTKLKSKDLNYSRISRALLHILLGIRSVNVREYISDGWHYYIRPLGFRRSSSALMRELKLSSSLPVISKNADAERILNDFYSEHFCPEILHPVRMFREGIAASDLYKKAVCSKCRQPFLSEYEHSVIIL